MQIRGAFGLGGASRGDRDKCVACLAEEMCPVELRAEHLREALLVPRRSQGIEPPGLPARIVAAARSSFENWFCECSCSGWAAPAPIG
jgi:hypothetical protein